MIIKSFLKATTVNDRDKCTKCEFDTKDIGSLKLLHICFLLL